MLNKFFQNVKQLSSKCNRSFFSLVGDRGRRANRLMCLTGLVCGQLQTNKQLTQQTNKHTNKQRQFLTVLFKKLDH